LGADRVFREAFARRLAPSKRPATSLRDAATPGLDMYLSSGPDHRTRRDSETKKKDTSYKNYTISLYIWGPQVGKKNLNLSQ